LTSTILSHLIRQADHDLKKDLPKNRLLRIWRLMIGYRSTYLLANLFTGLSATGRTLTLLVLSFFVDDVLSRSNPIVLGRLMDADVLNRTPLLASVASPSVPVTQVAIELILLIALAFVAFAIIEGTFSFLSGRFAAVTAEGIAFRLRNFLFDHVQRLSFSYHDRQQTGDLLQRCTSDVDAIRRFFAEQAVGTGRIMLLFLVNMAAIATINWQLALFSTICVPFVLVISLWFFQRISKKYDQYQDQEGVMTTRLQENLTGVRVVKAFARQQYEINKFDQENYKHYERGRDMLIWHAFFWPTLDLITGAQLVASYLVGALLVVDGQMSIGNYVAFAGMVVYIIFPMRNLGRLIVEMSRGLVSYDRVAEIIENDREPLGEGEAAPVSALKGEIVFDNVTFEYETGSPVLKNVSFTAKPGQVVALMGSTGSGKTSVVNLLTRFYDYGRGQITLDGIDLRDYPRDFLRRNIGIVEQEPFLFSRSIRENITYGVGREVSDDEVIRAAKAAAIHHVIEGFADSYNSMVGERGMTLSGGQKQRLAIARTLLKDPRILIMDDATSSVDTETEAGIRMALKELLPGRTAFIIAHRVQTVMSADLILVFDQGEIVQMGTHAELLRDEAGIYRRIFDMQSRIDEEVEREVAGE
jgi:ATP-binding cassette subfamily B protein